jgi:DNA polymerase-3 subunit epsilon
MWYEDPFLSLDYETTSANPDECRPVSFALAFMKGEKATKRRSLYSLVDCGVEIPADATRVHGVTNEHVRMKGLQGEDAYLHVRAELQRGVEEGSPLVIFNARFDWCLLHAEARRYGLEPPPRIAILDPLVIDRHMDKYRKGSRTLSAVCEHYGVELTDAHDALADCVAAARVMRCIARKYAEIRQRTPAELQDVQRRMHSQWLTNYNQYRVRSGQRPIARETWPI